MELRSFDAAVVSCLVETINVQASDPYFDRRYRSAFSSMLIVGLAGLFGVPQNCFLLCGCNALRAAPNFVFCGRRNPKGVASFRWSLATSRSFSMAIKEVG
jgi:hypothetical protein